MCYTITKVQTSELIELYTALNHYKILQLHSSKMEKIKPCIIQVYHVQ